MSISEAPEPIQAFTEAGRALIEQDRKLDELWKEEQALLAPIQERLTAIRRARGDVSGETELKIEEAMERASYEDFADPMRAMEIFDAAWNRGRGLSDTRKLFKRVYSDSYVEGGEFIEYGDQGKVYLSPVVALPRKTNAEKLQRTAERIEGAYRALVEIVGNTEQARILMICGDFNFDYSIYEVDGKWTIQTRYGSVYRTEDSLLALLQSAPPANHL